jgi:hypothetical protein
MGLMDKAREAALQAKAKAEQAAHQGQAKVAEMKENREEAALFRSLGEAVYAEQRQGGGHSSVDTALAALDAHYARAATDGTGGPSADGMGAPPPDVPPSAAPPTDVPPGG